jgi:DNA-binding MarR family transcriptional regulator
LIWAGRKITKLKGGKMPITRKQFEKGDFKKINKIEAEHPVVALLKKNSSKAFTVKEITGKTKMNPNTVRTALRSFIKKGIVEHKAPYFAAKVKSKK